MTETEGRTLGLDLGSARIGLAISDPLGVTAQPAGALERLGLASDLEFLRGLVDRHGVRRIVVGHPLLLSGRAGARAEDAQGFVGKLRSALPGVDVLLWDERLTTAEAERLLVSDGVRRRRRRDVIDAMAAALILQSWLDARGGAERS